MSNRRIVTKNLQAVGGTQPADGYTDKLVKNIPAEVVGVWTAISALITSATSDYPKETLLWIIFAIGVITTPLWILKQTTKPGMKTATTQILIATGSFMVWVFALGGPFSYLSFYRSLYGAMLLILYTFLIPLVNPTEGQKDTKS